MQFPISLRAHSCQQRYQDFSRAEFRFETCQDVKTVVGMLPRFENPRKVESRGGSTDRHRWAKIEKRITGWFRRNSLAPVISKQSGPARAIDSITEHQ